MRELALTLPAVAESIPLARRTLGRLAGALEPHLLDDARLLVSEIVTNGIRHGSGGGTVELRVAVDAYKVRIEVENHGPPFEPEVSSEPPERDSGWGLLLVDRLADRWGVVASRTTIVWFEIDRRPGRR